MPFVRWSRKKFLS